MESIKKMRFIDGTVLKLIAMVTMIFDHVGDSFFPDLTWMRIIGRIAMPIFAFCIAEGYAHTHDKVKYLTRMAIFAVISEVPFDLFGAGRVIDITHQNIMFTFAIAIAALLLYEKITAKGGKVSLVLGWLVLIAGAVLATVLLTDYTFTGVILVVVFYLLRKHDLLIKDGVGLACYLALRNMGVFVWGFLSFIVIAFYNGERGKGLKYLFYVFYPAHLLLIFVIRTLIG